MDLEVGYQVATQPHSAGLQGRPHRALTNEAPGVLGPTAPAPDPTGLRGVKEGVREGTEGVSSPTHPHACTRAHIHVHTRCEHMCTYTQGYTCTHMCTRTHSGHTLLAVVLGCPWMGLGRGDGTLRWDPPDGWPFRPNVPSSAVEGTSLAAARMDGSPLWSRLGALGIGKEQGGAWPSPIQPDPCPSPSTLSRGGLRHLSGAAGGRPGAGAILRLEQALPRAVQDLCPGRSPQQAPEQPGACQGGRGVVQVRKWAWASRPVPWGPAAPRGCRLGWARGTRWAACPSLEQTLQPLCWAGPWRLPGPGGEDCRAGEGCWLALPSFPLGPQAPGRGNKGWIVPCSGPSPQPGAPAWPVGDVPVCSQAGLLWPTCEGPVSGRPWLPASGPGTQEPDPG